MPEDRGLGRKKRVWSSLFRWFGSAEFGESDATVSEVAPGPSPESIRVTEISAYGEAADAEASPRVHSVSEKLGMLKQLMDFNPELMRRLSAIQSSREMLLFLDENLIFRFLKLREIGIVNPQSYKVLEELNLKLGVVLANDVPPVSGNGGVQAEALQKENAELREKVEKLGTKHVNSRIISEKELTQENEINFLQSKLREQQSRLNTAKSRLTFLTSYQELAQSLKAKNGLLQSKLDHQSRLLQSLTAASPKNQELIGTIERLTAENKKFKLELDRQTNLLSQLKDHIPQEALPVVENLLERNARLRSDLEEKESVLEGVAGASETDLLDQIERLSESNFQLKNTLKTQELIDSFVNDGATGEGEPGKVIEALRMENERLEQSLAAKEEQIKVLSSEPVANKELMKAYVRLQSKYKEVYRETQLKDQLYRQEQKEKQDLASQARERTSMIREYHTLKTELDNTRRLVEVLRKSELQCKILKKERGEIEAKCDRIAAELDNVNRKLAKVTAEYDLLMKEYEHIFEP